MKILIKNNCEEILKSLIMDYWRMEGMYFMNSLDVLSKKYLVKKYEIEEIIATYSVFQISLPCIECHKIKRINITNRMEFRTTLVCRVCKIKKKQELFQQRKVNKNLKETVDNKMKETVILDTLHLVDDKMNPSVNPYKMNEWTGFLRNDFQVNFFTNYYCDLYLKRV
jgi:hypothetical protein